MCFIPSKVFLPLSEDAALLRPVSRVSSTVLPSPASRLFLLFSQLPPPLPQLVENTLCIAALIPSSFILNRLHSSFSPCHSLSHSLLSLSVCLSVYLSVFRGRPSISQKSILSSFPNRISLPCCHTGFSVVPAASRLGQ